MGRNKSGSGGDGAARSAYDRALGMLARREYSQRELRTRLERAGCDEEESGAAIARLRDQDYQDDHRFGEMVLRARVTQGYGPERVHAELRAHGLGDDAIRNLIAAAAVDWAALAAAQLRKKYGVRPPADYAARAKRAAFLSRRGFPAETVRIVVHSEVGDASD
ncbi:MAG TPA: regulatory protein RecX [Rhodanobacteraceae bacterium]